MIRFKLMRNTALCLLVCSCQATVSVISDTVAAEASITACDNPPANYWGGWAGDSINGAWLLIEGTSAQMTYELGNICSSGDPNHFTNWSISWDMVYNSAVGGYAQSGIDYQYGWSCWLQFAEQKRSSSYTPADQYVPQCIGNGEVHHVYQKIVNINPTNPDWRVDSAIDSTTILESAWNPFGAWGNPPWSAGWSGETSHDHSDIPGYMAAGYPPPVHYNQMQVQNYSDNNFFGICTNQVLLHPVTSLRYSEDLVACDHARSWTSG